MSEYPLVWTLEAARAFGPSTARAALPGSLTRGRMNSVLIEFEGGERAVEVVNG